MLPRWLSTLFELSNLYYVSKTYLRSRDNLGALNRCMCLMTR